MWANLPFAADLVTFTEEILNGKLHVLCSAIDKWSSGKVKLSLTSCLSLDGNFQLKVSLIRKTDISILVSIYTTVHLQIKL